MPQETRYTTPLTITRGYTVTFDTPAELPKEEAQKLYEAFVEYTSEFDSGDDAWEAFLENLLEDLKEDGAYPINTKEDDDHLTSEYAELYAKCTIHLDLVHAEDDVNELEVEG